MLPANGEIALKKKKTGFASLFEGMKGESKSLFGGKHEFKDNVSENSNKSD